MKKKITEEALYISNERFQAAIRAVEGFMWIVDNSARIIDEQPYWEELTGQSFEEYYGFGWKQAVHPDNIKDFMKVVNKSLADGTPFESQQILKTRDGKYRQFSVRANPVRNPDGTIREWVGVHTDITLKQLNEKRIQHMATHDSLTNLPNRALLGDRLDHLLKQRVCKQHAILFMDLNRFKIINDSLGHQAGDQVLMIVAKRLCESVRPGDTVARHGGDEFVIIFEDIASESDVERLTVKLLKALNQPLYVADHEFTLDASIGVALYPRDGKESQALLRHADLAMYLAKKDSGNTFNFFEKSINVRSEERLKIENDLKHAIERNELYLNYQPKVNVKKDSIYCLEALVRWNHPTRGLIPPSEFIPVAEEIGMINSIGEWVFKEACTQLNLWRVKGQMELTVAINLSVQQLINPSFLSVFKTIVQETQVDPTKIEFEITETRLMDNINSHEKLLSDLRNFGFSLAIDDFGTGYSSLSYLKRLPIKTLKIDRSFIKDILDNSDDAAIVSATISMANKMNLCIVAEGIETFEQAQYLSERGCSFMQGYYFSKPLAPENVKNFIDNYKTQH